MHDNATISGEAAVEKDNEPYLPARYKQKVREKQQRRRLRKILTVTIIIAAIALVLVFLAGFLGTGRQLAPATPAIPATTGAPAATPASVATVPFPNITMTPSPEYSIAPGVPLAASGGSLSLSDAAAALREYYPKGDYTISSVNYTAGSSRNLFGFEMQRAGSPAGMTGFVVFIDAATGFPWSPGQDTAAVTVDKAKTIAASAFPDVRADTVRVWYEASPDKGGVWQFILASGNTTRITGSVDASSGELVSFIRSVPHAGRPADPVISRETAENTASQYISDRNGGPLPLNLTSARYEAWGTPPVPVAGQYLFSWERTFLDYPVDTDGVKIAVDAVTGDVIGYDKVWTTQGYAFSQTTEQAVAQRDATFAVMQAAKNVFPDAVESVRILSAEMRWNNRHAPGTGQQPGSVPLEWKVVFDDATIRADPSLSQGVGWVDIQTGNVTSLEYSH